MRRIFFFKLPTYQPLPTLFVFLPMLTFLKKHVKPPTPNEQPWDPPHCSTARSRRRASASGGRREQRTPGARAAAGPRRSCQAQSKESRRSRSMKECRSNFFPHSTLPSNVTNLAEVQKRTVEKLQQLLDSKYYSGECSSKYVRKTSNLMGTPNYCEICVKKLLKNFEENLLNC